MGRIRASAFECSFRHFFQIKRHTVAALHNLRKNLILQRSRVARDLMDQFFLAGFGTTSHELQEAYTVRLAGLETIAGQKTTHLELIPKSKEVLQHLKRFELWIADENGLPVQQRFVPAGQSVLVTYTNLKVNAGLPDSALKLQLPKGVKREFPQK